MSTCITRYLAKCVTLQVVLLCCAVQQAMLGRSNSARQAAACVQAKSQARQGASAWHAPADGRPVLQWVLLAKVRLCVFAMLDFTILPCSIRHGLPACCRSPGCATRSQLLVVRVLVGFSGSKVADSRAGLGGVRSYEAFLCTTMEWPRRQVIENTQHIPQLHEPQAPAACAARGGFRRPCAGCHCCQEGKARWAACVQQSLLM